MKKETAKKAAKWWADHLRGNARLDNGDRSETGAMTLVLATILQAKEKEKQSAEQIDRFEAELTKVLLKEKGNYVTVGVDYDPDYLLCVAAELAELPLGGATLPWKTTMWIEDDSVKVRLGYQGELQSL